MAVEAYFGAETVWMCDYDKYASIAIQERWNKPNLGDLTKVDWSTVEPIDILTAGYPCQPFSHAGQRKGTNDARHIWPYIAQAISILRPKYVILENVRGHLSLGFKEVLKDLAQHGYNARWRIVRASDVGAPHQRARLFIVAYPNGGRQPLPTEWQLTGKQQFDGIGQEELATNTNCDACEESRRADRNIYRTSSEIINGADWQEHRCSCKDASNTNNKQLSPDRQMPELGGRLDTRFAMHLREIPDALVEGKLNTKFVEYMMGLPEGWVTDLPISRAQQFKMLGNGVVPQQAHYALSQLL